MESKIKLHFFPLLYFYSFTVSFCLHHSHAGTHTQTHSHTYHRPFNIASLVNRLKCKYCYTIATYTHTNTNTNTIGMKINCVFVSHKCYREGKKRNITLIPKYQQICICAMRIHSLLLLLLFVDPFSFYSLFVLCIFWVNVDNTH